MSKQNFIAVSALNVAVWVVAACSGEAVPPSSGHYKTIAIAPTQCTVEEEYTATLRGKQSVEVRPQVGGVITAVCVEEGADVKKGDVLFVIDQTPYKAAVMNAEAQVGSARSALANAELTLKSKQALRQKGVVGDFEVEQARNNVDELRAALKNAEASLLTARNNLSYTEVKSPTDGELGMINYRVGALVGTAMETPLTTVADNATIYAYYSITEAEMQRLTTEHGSLKAAVKAMPQVSLKLTGGGRYAYGGRVDAVSGLVDAETGAVVMRATFDNPDRKLRSGGSGVVVVPHVRTDAIVIPQEATYEIQDKHFVYVIVHGKTKSQEIKIDDYDNGHDFIVTSGLKRGDRIIAEGAGLLHEGVEVEDNGGQTDASTRLTQN
ncbi:MAG: efflux RND transporter periplasmic adaptor subunit [Alloprevotella sp.]